MGKLIVICTTITLIIAIICNTIENIKNGKKENKNVKKTK